VAAGCGGGVDYGDLGGNRRVLSPKRVWEKQNPDHGGVWKLLVTRGMRSEGGGLPVGVFQLRELAPLGYKSKTS